MLRRTLYFLIHELAVFVANKTVDPALRSSLPNIYDRLDYEMPFILRMGTPGSLAHMITSLIIKETDTRDPKVLAKLVDQVCELYDPRKGANG